MDNSPTQDVWSTPPTTPMANLTPSLSRKTSRPSSLRIESKHDEYHPDITLTEESLSPETAKAKSPDSAGNTQGTPRARDASIPHPPPTTTINGGGERTATTRAQQLAQSTTRDRELPPKSPYFVHSHFDKGASLTDWLRSNGPPSLMDRDGGIDVVTEQTSSPEEDDSVFERDEEESNYEQMSLTRQLAETAVGVREMSKQLGRARIQSNIQNVLIITKAKDNRLIKLTRDLALYLMTKKRKGGRRGLVVYVDAQLRTSRRFDAEGMQKAHPELFEPLPRRQSTSSGTSISSNSSYENVKHASGPSEIGQLRYWTNEMCNSSPHLFDFVVTLGGDGTVLYTSWLFQRIVPPVLPFALGSLGFLTNFDFADHQTAMDNVLDSGIRVNLRMRFTCTVYRAYNLHNGKSKKGKRKAVKKADTGEIMMQNVERGGWEALEGTAPDNCCSQEDKEITCFTTRPAETFEILNDLVVDRGPSPYMSLLELFADEHHLTTVQADGLCVATPTGSTAYSLSAGGSLVHPEIPSMLITPLCPHTLSFRPMLLPDNMELRICLPFNSRSTAWASFDGRGRVELKQGDHIKVTASKFPFPTVCADRSSTDWFQSIGRTLKWNERERQKSFVVVEENPAVEHLANKRERKEEAKKKAEAEEEEDEVSDEEEGFDIDVIEDDTPSSSSSAAGDSSSSPGMQHARETMLQPDESKLGKVKTMEQSFEHARAQEAAHILVAATSAGADMDSTPRDPNHQHSGISSPSRYLPPPGDTTSSSRHVAFSDRVPTTAPATQQVYAPRPMPPGHQQGQGADRGRNDGREHLKTPTLAETRRGSARFIRSRSAEARHHHPRAFAVWGQDESESENTASEEE